MNELQGPGARFVNHPLVLLLLFALIVSVLVWTFFAPRGPVVDNEPSADVAALRQAAARAKLLDFASEAQRLYRRGLGQCREGDVAGARQTWADVVVVFGNKTEERPWVRLAESGLELLKGVEQPAEARRAAVQTAIQEIHELREAGKGQEAEVRREALAGLYGSDPAVRALLK